MKRSPNVGKAQRAKTVRATQRPSVEALETRSLLAGHTFAEPDGGWAYVFHGDGSAAGEDAFAALDGTWDHDNGSDAWDGTGIGEGLAGGVSALTDGDTDFIRIQDTGDPRGITGASDPSNRKMYFTHPLVSDFEEGSEPDNLDTILDDGITLYFRMRVATAASGPIDDQYAPGATETEPWPAEGIGYSQHDGGKSVIAVKQIGGTGANIAFGLDRGAHVNAELFTDLDGNSQDGLILPSLLQDVNPDNNSDPINSPGNLSTGVGNVLTVDDVTQWQEFWVTIEAGTTTVDGFDDGTHVVNVYYGGASNPLLASRFGITAATGNDQAGSLADPASYLAIGTGATPRIGAVDIDYVAWAPGIHVPTLAPVDGQLVDITAPGDTLVLVNGENDGDGNAGPPPGAEGVEHVIDDVTQKHLNFLDLGSGFIVTPSAGSSIVTGLRLYSANDAIERDPASYLLEGQLNDGEFVVISQGDLALPDARNAGGNLPVSTALAHQEILFDNAEVYTSYRLTFPSLKNAEAANSMQIAEVEFLGVLAPIPLNDVTSPGDLIELINGENDSDGNSGPPPGAEGVEHAIDDVTQKYLNFLDFNSGFQVTPAAGMTVVSGLRLYTANDATERDPASYRLEGVAADGTVTLISAGELALPLDRNAGGNIPVETTLFHQEIRFENSTAYVSYRVTFPTLRDAEAANSMQIAEVELLGEVVEPAGIAGDIDGDGEVAFADFLILSAAFGTDVPAGTGGDIDGDGNVGFSDFLILSANFGQSAAAVDAAFAS